MLWKRKTNSERFKKLTAPHVGFLYNMALGYTKNTYDAEDLVQEAILIAFDKFYQLKDKKSCRKWLFVILRNRYFKDIRRRDKGLLIDDTDSYLDQIDDQALDHLETAIDHKKMSREIQLILDRLPEKLKMPLLLYYMEDMTYREIAVMMDVPIGTVMSRLSRGKSELKNKIVRQLNIGNKTGQIIRLFTPTEMDSEKKTETKDKRGSS